MVECKGCGLKFASIESADGNCSFCLTAKARERHPLSERFHAVLKAAGELHDKKCKDYGSATDPFANIRASTAWGVPAWQGACIRACDKIKRLQAYVENGTLANESVEDSFDDAIVYFTIAKVLWQELQESDAK